MVTVVRVTPAEAAALYASSIKQSTNNNEHYNGGGKTSDACGTLSRGINNENEGGKNRSLSSSEDLISGREIKKRQRTDEFVIDLSDFPPQVPIPKSKGRIKEGSSKYTGVCFNKANNKWQAEIWIDRKNRHIGYYENEEEAAIDYARAVLKYQGQDALDNLRERKLSSSNTDRIEIDLTDVPPQLPPIPKSKGYVKEGASKYAGVYFNKSRNTWTSKITIDGKSHRIGYNENEEEAAIDYARAVFKYKGQAALNKDKARKRKSFGPSIDLSDVPPQLPIPKGEVYIKEGASKYTGVTFNKRDNRWTAQISIEGKARHIGYYENEEEAAIEYARAVFKYKGQGELDKAREQKSCGQVHIDLRDVLPQQPIPKSKWYVKDGASNYAGVSFEKSMKKWKAQIYIDGKQRSIGYYENEEEAAADYARALFKFKGQDALDKSRKQISSGLAVDLTDVPPQQPIPKSEEQVEEGASKYVGVYPNKANNKWTAIITIDSKPRYIGSYKNEEQAAIDFARAVFKYRGQLVFEDIMKKRQRADGFEIDLADVPPQLPILKSKGRIKEGASKYAGVTLETVTGKWKAQITLEGKKRFIGRYENEEEAGIDYARAVFKYQGQGVLDKKRKLNSSRPGIVIDLTDVPPKLPILKNVGRTKEGSSKYAGVTFDKANNKWKTQIMIEGKKRYIGHYEDEVEAAVDYARAVFKYKKLKGQGQGNENETRLDNVIV